MKEKSMNKYLKTLFAAFAVAAISLVSTYEVRAQKPALFLYGHLLSFEYSPYFL